jgi:hypothetical protein
MKNSNYLKIMALTALIFFILPADTQTAPRPEYLHPDLVRAEGQTLNGARQFEFDDANGGVKNGWYKASVQKLSRTIQVSFAFQTKLSGINDQSYMMSSGIGAS